MKQTKTSKHSSLGWECFLVGRILRAKKKDGFLSVITGFSFVGICLGVATLIIVMSVMGGFREELLSRIIGMKGHALVYTPEGAFPDDAPWLPKLKGIPHVTQVCPLIERQTILVHASQSRGILALGLSLDSLKERTLLAQSLQTPLQPEAFEGDVVWVGQRMAEMLGLRVGDCISLMDPQGEMTPFGAVPKQNEFRVAGMFEVGMVDYDKNIVIMPLRTAQEFFNLPHLVTQIEVFTDNLEVNDRVVRAISRQVPNHIEVLGWKHGDSQFFQAVQMERNVMFLILMLIILIASFNIISGLVMLVKDKTKDIAILKTLGASRFSVMRVFLFIGSSIGVVGTGLGVLLGLFITLHLDEVLKILQALTGQTIFDPEVYYLTHLPYQIHTGEVVTIALTAIALSVLAALYPSRRAARLDPVVALREG